MSLSNDIYTNFPVGVINRVTVNKDAILHGEPAITATVILSDGRTVEGTFTKDQKAGFGGVEFETKKDIVGLMTAKVQAVLDGKAER